jgi:hypothetical protein
VVKEDEMGECMAWIQEKRNSYRVLVGKPEAELGIVDTVLKK